MIVVTMTASVPAACAVPASTTTTSTVVAAGTTATLAPTTVAAAVAAELPRTGSLLGPAARGRFRLPDIGYGAAPGRAGAGDEPDQALSTAADPSFL